MPAGGGIKLKSLEAMPCGFESRIGAGQEISFAAAGHVRSDVSKDRLGIA